jgi:hypothetical protein
MFSDGDGYREVRETGSDTLASTLRHHWVAPITDDSPFRSFSTIRLSPSPVVSESQPDAQATVAIPRKINVKSPMLLSVSRQFLLTLATTAVLVLGGWQANPAWAASIPDPPPSAAQQVALAKQAVIEAREAQTARIAAAGAAIAGYAEQF